MSPKTKKQLLEFILVQVRSLRHSEDQELRAAAALEELELEKKINGIKSSTTQSDG